MSVYTQISREELEHFLSRFAIGQLQNYQGISEGIENTNYFVDTSTGRYVLTVFETLGRDELPYFLDIMAFLAEHGIPSAHPVACEQEGYLHELKGKPAAIVNALPGKGVSEPTLAQCQALGANLARLHLAGMAFEGHRDNDRGPGWWQQTFKQVKAKLQPEDQQAIEEELQYQATLRKADLPRGLIHADLFRDNALFSGDELTGIIDFYYACNDVLIYDVAVTINDWCVDGRGELDAGRYGEFLRAYQNVRPFSAEEEQAWGTMLRAAALRFWLSRLQDKLYPREGALTHIKDPDVFKRILLAHRCNGASLSTPAIS